MIKNYKFPEGFFWGASTASHQVEGNTQNQWSKWEISPSRLAQLEHDGLIERYGKENFISGPAADHYHRYEEDFDDAAIKHYREVIASIRKNGMEPFVTLWHWTFPIWFRDKGGFASRKNIEYFARFAEKMVSELTDVNFW